MPLVSVMQYRVSGAIPAGAGTQTVTGTLTLANPSIVEIDPTVFTVAGTYTVFTYGTLSGSVAWLQADLTGTGFSTATFADTGSSITVTLS